MEDDDVTNAGVDDSRLRELYERRLDARSVAARGGCVSPEAILTLVRREGTEDERLATLDHVMTCADCAREFELLRALEDAGTTIAAARPNAADGGSAPRIMAEHPDRDVRVHPRVSWRRYAPLALAASLILVVGVGVLRRDFGTGDGEVTRGETTVTLLAPPLEVRGGARDIPFVWRPVPGAASYQVEVIDAAGSVAFSATTRDTTVAFADVRRLTPDADYRWWVRALGAGGGQVASEMRRLRVRSE